MFLKSLLILVRHKFVNGVTGEIYLCLRHERNGIPKTRVSISRGPGKHVYFKHTYLTSVQSFLWINIEYLSSILVSIPSEGQLTIGLLSSCQLLVYICRKLQNTLKGWIIVYYYSKRNCIYHIQARRILFVPRIKKYVSVLSYICKRNLLQFNHRESQRKF